MADACHVTDLLGVDIGSIGFWFGRIISSNERVLGNFTKFNGIAVVVMRDESFRSSSE